MYTTFRTRLMVALGAALILAALLGCGLGDPMPNPDGNCVAPAPCGQDQGANP